MRASVADMSAVWHITGVSANPGLLAHAEERTHA